MWTDGCEETGAAGLDGGDASSSKGLWLFHTALSTILQPGNYKKVVTDKQKRELKSPQIMG